MKYDLSLFKQLNREYKDKRIVESPWGYDVVLREKRALEQAKKINKLVNLENKRVLEVGCGYGDLSKVMAEKYNCEVVAIDIKKRDSWKDFSTVTFIEGDISKIDMFKLGKFDRIISIVAWEHIKHPFSSLEKCKALLRDKTSLFYLYANLYRGPSSSHLYREVFFPWPHLLFSDDVFEEFYREIGDGEIKSPSWINKLTYAQYLHYFKILNFKIHKEKLVQKPIDNDFYKRFEDKLSKYPCFDLMTNFFVCILSKLDFQDDIWGQKDIHTVRNLLESVKRRLR